MALTRIHADILAVRVIPNVDDALVQQFNLQPYHRSLAMFTSSIDDVGYTALDEATKRADVEVAYARSFYAGAAHASGPLSGEMIGVLAGPSPDEVKAGIDAILQVTKSDAYFEALDEEKNHALYAHVVARTGSYLSKEAGIDIGEPLAYLIAPPLEAMYGLDVALKAADVELVKFFGPPSETNFGGGFLTGSQSACQAAADAFRQAILDIARNPVHY
ncbi:MULTISPECIES: ethanolamine utilization microcompartment protein EutL [Priestia]|uniref:Ethanolamine utilization protein EutL n=2 Tax=Priestia TaxID=2800373 RepID=D5E1W4_PRIM1|nr:MULTISPECIES: ethanolamine utilization microcompartment protein EutL [Priestia]AVX09608.1 microcompartment protein EutL [Bacillus sp. Y-01]KOP75727.1 ethanolamine utilization protein EutL [Bacillus sp. FJAT-21351]KQU12912.1 microcompartment protein EutL [Bacillus sp. Leaf75]MCJ7985178.1 ethanolamine utilization microcompartment protein EutL [Priestia sp. OVL9]MDH6653325.1 ethanolamine utilization protein EutL [Bacillus sp. PvP124]